MKKTTDALSAAEVRESMKTVAHWRRRGRVIRRTYELKDFPAALRFVNAVGRHAEKVWHHPDIDIRWNAVTLALTTHDAGGLTALDFESALKYDGLAQAKA